MSLFVGLLELAAREVCDKMAPNVGHQPVKSQRNVCRYRPWVVRFCRSMRSVKTLGL